MKILSVITIIFFLNSCQTKIEKTKSNSTTKSVKFDTILMLTEKDTFKVLSGDWKYTFDMYSKSDSLEINNLHSEPFVKMLTINNQKVGIVIENSLLKIYHLKKGNFQQSSKDSLEGVNWKTSKCDLNFDGNIDIVLSEVEGVHGNSFTTALIFDTKTKTFIHKKCFDLPNLEIDNKKKQLRTKWYSSACGNSKKAIFINTQDSIELLESINYFDSECGGKENEKRYIIFTEKKINRKVVKDSILLKPKKAWKFFEQSLWNTKNEW